MIVGYRYARRKLQEREARRQAEELQQSQDRPAVAGGSVQPRAGREAIPSSAPVSTMRARNSDPGPVVTSEKPSGNTLTPEEKAEQRRRRSYRWKVVFGLFMPFTLQALDTTIVAAALPTIAVEFSES